MKDRILFWIDYGLMHFGIAKSIQDNYDCDMFAIIDVNVKEKKFFIEQQLVHFSKVWYFRDYVTKKDQKPDMKYLKHFEEKYKINLWQLAYSERIFFQFNEYYKFTYDEILLILEQECKFFENTLDEINPNFLFIRITDYHRLHLLYEICKARGIKTLMLGLPRFGFRTMISTEYDKIDYLDEILHDNDYGSSKTIVQLQDYMEKFSHFRNVSKLATMGQSKNMLKRVVKYLLFMILARNINYGDFYAHYGMSLLRIKLKKIPFIIKKFYRRYFINKNCVYEIDSNIKFVYFPLHVEPERSISITAPFYTNQVEVVTHIAKSLPVGYQLYVKDHPVMKIRGWRKISFYKKILDLPNVKLIHPSIKPDILFKNCSMVVTIAGTTALEAAFYEKPSIVFVDTIYSHLPFVHRIRNLEDLPNVIRTWLQKEFDFNRSLNDFVNLIDKTSFEFDLIGLKLAIRNKFYKQFFLGDANILVSEMKSFLKEHSSEFEKIALEHIKKIKQHKEHESKSRPQSLV